jgi:NAD(P)-dependent dehydrogenase (short-subunit alcohol dehydrogenase family)
MRRALVTGASSGIGAAAAHALAGAGYRIALLARRREPLEAVRNALAGSGHLCVTCDLQDPAAIRAAADTLQREWGGLELVVANAGIGYRALISELDDELCERVFATNVLAPMRLARDLLPLLKAGDAPVWINVSSVVGRRGIPGQAVYSASKAALSSLSEALRLEWAVDNIAVCTLNPALTATGFFEAQPNPGALPDPDLAGAAGPDDVAREILALAEHPRPERSLRWKWWLLGALTPIFPRLSDRLLASRLGGGWQAPKR